MKKTVVWVMTFILIFSGLTVSVAEMPVANSTERGTECEEQLESDSEENLATQCEGNSATEEEKQPESESEADLATEEEKQPEPESEADLTTEEEEQPESESEADLTTEEEKQPESESGKDLTTEGEEQEESESEENLANACESQPESESKENLAIEGEEQLEFGSEDNPEIDCEEQEEPESEENLEIECTEEFYSGEGLVTESEEPLGLDSEEKLVTEDEEQPKFNSKEKLAPNCKRPRIWSTKIRDIDFSALDDSKNELDEFTQVFTNTGLEFPSGEKNGRTYYMYFGDLNNKRPVNSLVGETYRDYDDDWSRPLPAMDQALNSIGNTYYVQAQNFSVATALAQNPTLPNGIVSYYFGNGIASKHPNGNGLVIAHASTKSHIATFQSGAMPLLKLYKNEKTHELIGYTVVMNGMDVDGYVKIKMSPVRGTEGRINVSMKYLKKSDTYPLTTLAYSVHMDVGMRHENTKLYSLGNHEGFYFNEENMGDGDNYRLTFFRDGYTNHPTAFSTIQRSPSNKPFHMYFQTLSSSNRPVYDPGKDAMYDLKPDPGWAVRWDHINQKPGDVREVNLELAVTDGSGVAPEKGPPVIQLDKDGEYTDNGYRMTGTWKDPDSEYVSLFYIISGSSYHQIGEFKNSNLNTDVPWEYTVPIKQVEKGLDHEIMVYAVDDDSNLSNFESMKIRPTLTITERVFGKDGQVPTEIAPNETLNYEILVDSGYIAKDKGTYGQVTITQTYDTHLKPPTDLNVIDENGQKIGTATYNASTKVIEAKLDAGTPRSKKVNVTFKAEVKDDAAEGEFIVGQATVSGKYSTGDEVNKTSNEVRITIIGSIGVLEFVSAPQVIDFGKKLAISPKNKTYHPINPDTPLAVKDNRPLTSNPSWTMTAKLDTPLTGSTTGSKLDSLRYSYDGNISILTEDASVQIYKKKTENREVVNISETWQPDGDGLYLEVAAGTARADAYTGSIKWVLQNVPINEE